MSDIIEINFKKPIGASCVSQYTLPKEISWNMNENQDAVGIYFNKKGSRSKKMKEAIHDVLWFFGEFEEDD